MSSEENSRFSVPEDLGHSGKYVIDVLGAEYTGREEIRPPFPCLTGASNTSTSLETTQSLPSGIVAIGIDTLHLNFGIDSFRNPAMFERIDLAKNKALDAGYKGSRGEPIDLFGNQFMVMARGSRGGYPFLLQNGDLELQIMPDATGGKTSPELRAIFRSEFLWREGEISAYNKVINFLNEMAFINYCQVSRVDLTVDQIMQLPEIDLKNQVVTRLRKKAHFAEYINGIHDEGYFFGKGSPLGFRLYDKLHETKEKKKQHIWPVWQVNGWDGETPVSRLEMQLRREGLRKYDPEMDFVTFMDSRADIWLDGTTKNLRIVDPSTATRKERAKPMDFWAQFQECGTLFGQRNGILPHKVENPNYYQLMAQAMGCLSTAWAMEATVIGDREATRKIESECGFDLSLAIIQEGIKKKPRFKRLN